MEFTNSTDGSSTIGDEATEEYVTTGEMTSYPTSTVGGPTTPDVAFQSSNYSNFSTTPIPRAIGDPLIAVAVAGALLSIWIILGNFFVILLFSFNRKLKRISNLFIINLAVADFLVGVLDTPVYTMYTTLGYWPWDHWVCDAWSAIDYTTCSVSLFAIIAISVDRYSSLVDPIGHRTTMTRRKARYMITTTWVISIVIYACPNFLWPRVQGYHKVPEGVCVVEYLDVTWFVTVQTFLGYLLPLLVQIALYVKIYQVAHRISGGKNNLGHQFTNPSGRKNKSSNKIKSKSANPTDVNISSGKTGDTEEIIIIDGDTGGNGDQRGNASDSDPDVVAMELISGCVNRGVDDDDDDRSGDQTVHAYDNVGFESEIGAGDDTAVDTDCGDSGETVPIGFTRKEHGELMDQQNLTPTESFCEKDSESNIGGDYELNVLSRPDKEPASFHAEAASLAETAVRLEITNINPSCGHPGGAVDTGKCELNGECQHISPEGGERGVDAGQTTATHCGETNQISRDRNASNPLPDNTAAEISQYAPGNKVKTPEGIHSTSSEPGNTNGPNSPKHRRLHYVITHAVSKFSLKRKSKPGDESAVRFSNSSPNRSPTRSSNARKALVTVTTLCAAFILCWMPYHVVALINTFCSKCIQSLTFEAVYWIYYTNSALNPLCYALANKSFRQAFKELITRGKLY